MKWTLDTNLTLKDIAETFKRIVASAKQGFGLFSGGNQSPSQAIVLQVVKSNKSNLNQMQQLLQLRKEQQNQSRNQF